MRPATSWLRAPLARSCSLLLVALVAFPACDDLPETPRPRRDAAPGQDAATDADEGTHRTDAEPDADRPATDAGDDAAHDEGVRPEDAGDVDASPRPDADSDAAAPDDAEPSDAEPSDAAPIDDTPPTIAFSEPAAPARFQVDLPIRLTADDDRAVAEVELHERTADGETRPLQRWALPPYEWTWRPEPEGPTGTRHLVAVATDTAGNQATATLDVVFAPPGGDCGDADPTWVAAEEGPRCGTTLLELEGEWAAHPETTLTWRLDGAPLPATDGLPDSLRLIETGVEAAARTVEVIAERGRCRFVLSQPIEFNPANCPQPRADFTAPAPDTWVGDVAQVGLNTAEVHRVRLFLGGRAVTDLEPDAGGAVAHALNTDGLPEGPVALVALAQGPRATATVARRALNIDTAPPTLEILTPEEAAPWGDAVQLTLQAEDASGIREIRIQVADIDRRLQAPPWSAQLDLLLTPSGEHPLVVTATDGAGRIRVVERTVLVDRPPTVAFLAPEADARVPGPTRVAVETTDREGPVTVELFVDGALAGEFDASGELLWTPEYIAGPRTIRAVARDTAGQTATTERTVHIDHPLELTLLACPDEDDEQCVPVEEVHFASDEIRLRAIAQDDHGPPGRVVFFIGRGGPNERSFTSRNAPFDWALNTLPLPDGLYQIDVSAVDAIGQAWEQSWPLRLNNCDRDEDGYIAERCGGDDCNDDDPDIHPDAADPLEDGVDRNCDGFDGPRPVDPEDPSEGGLAPQTEIGPSSRLVQLTIPADAAAAQAGGCTVVGVNGGSTLAAWLRNGGIDDLSRFLVPDENGDAPVVTLTEARGWRFGRTVDEVGRVELRFFSVQRTAQRHLIAPGALEDPTDIDSRARVRFANTALDAEGRFQTVPGTFVLPFPFSSEYVLDIVLEQATVRGQLTVDGPGFADLGGVTEGYWTDPWIREWLGQAQLACNAGAVTQTCTILRFLMPPDWRNGVGALRNALGGFDTTWNDGAPVPCPGNTVNCDAISVCALTAGVGSVLHGLAAVPDPPCVIECDRVADCATWTSDECPDLDANDRVDIRAACLADCTPELANDTLAAPLGCTARIDAAREHLQGFDALCPLD